MWRAGDVIAYNSMYNIKKKTKQQTIESVLDEFRASGGMSDLRKRPLNINVIS